MLCRSIACFLLLLEIVAVGAAEPVAEKKIDPLLLCRASAASGEDNVVNRLSLIGEKANVSIRLDESAKSAKPMTITDNVYYEEGLAERELFELLPILLAPYRLDYIIENNEIVIIGPPKVQSPWRHAYRQKSKELEEGLRRPMNRKDFEFAETPLSDAIEFMGQQSKTNLRLMNVKLSPPSPVFFLRSRSVTFRLTKDDTFENCLEKFLRHTNSVAIIQDDGILIVFNAACQPEEK